MCSPSFQGSKIRPLKTIGTLRLTISMGFWCLIESFNLSKTCPDVPSPGRAYIQMLNRRWWVMTRVSLPSTNPELECPAGGMLLCWWQVFGLVWQSFKASFILCFSYVHYLLLSYWLLEGNGGSWDTCNPIMPWFFLGQSKFHKLKAINEHFCFIISDFDFWTDVKAVK